MRRREPLLPQSQVVSKATGIVWSPRAMATLTAAEAIGIAESVGSIEEGKQANLVVLKSNPIDDIGNTRDIVRVIKFGQWYEPAGGNSPQ